MPARFKTLPNYEYIKDGHHIVFNGEGIYETNDKTHVGMLSKARPFIQRVDVPDKPVNKTAEKPVRKPESPATKSTTKK